MSNSTSSTAETATTVIEREYTAEEYQEKYGGTAVCPDDSSGQLSEQDASIRDSSTPSQIPNSDELEDGDRQTLDGPQMDRAVPIASAILGTEVGAQLLARDLVSGVAENLVEKMLDMMEQFAADVDVFVGADGTRYQLTRFTSLTGKQRKAAFGIVDEVKGMLNGDTIDVNGILSTLMGCGRAEEFFAILYVPEGEKYRPESVAERIAAMEDLTLGQMLGATYRFFISKGSFIRAGIQHFLVELVDRKVLTL